MIDLAANWARIRRSVAAAAERVDRDPTSVRIVAASKTKSVDVLRAAIDVGIREFGENYVQEAADKIARIDADVRWHMIGHLQRNKSARAVDLFDVIHTLDSVDLGRALGRHGRARQDRIDTLIEVNLGGESTKTGIRPDRVADLLDALAGEEYLCIDGLMTIPPPAPPEVARHFFRELRLLRDRLRSAAPPNAPLRELSMGMTDDFEVAVEEGATMIRVGRALLGEREAWIDREEPGRRHDED